MFGGSIGVFVVDVADSDQLNGFAFDLELRQSFDVRTKTPSTRPDKTDSYFVV
jgi:hypothetical protein